MKFREAKIEDLDQLSKLFHSYRQLSVSLDNSAPESESADWIESRLKDGSGVFLLATADEQVLGFATLYQGFSSISLNKYWVLNDIYVSKSARGLGLGRALMEYIEAYAKSTNAKGIELETSLDNVVAQSLYEDLGYLENTQYKRYFKKAQL
ncbi:GNAT family N-acetyltransferase [Vibrio sp. J1-1]|uniref:GNAT family N-acetyltransferase n=1 Tax=Vibrio sp. J1-1 TaxID=2912251 RepID=UPI001F2EA5C8|nr:GNAT family N-acetyltransferase [Vibrio sp. J1-1]MBR9876657.1 GNAT family N-acetyltransferase [Vibrionaceae bacterium]MCF7484244.1 GNAT family N-acetyltransferase [Vibrio sp. J1-1]